jgi:hypothetical protein
MLWVLLAGCSLFQGPSQQDSAEPEPSGPGRASWTIEPPALHLGEAPVGQPITGFVELTNTGAEDLLVMDLGDADNPWLALSLAGAPVLAPDASTLITATWSPPDPGTLDQTLDLILGSSAQDAQSAPLPVSGTAVGAAATLSTSSYDFGTLGLGCTEELSLTLTNTGNAELRVEAVTLHGEPGFEIDAPDDLPWYLAPFQSHQLDLRFAPEQQGLVVGELELDTDLGLVTAELMGEGSVTDQRTQHFTVGEQSRATIIVDVNNTAIPESTEDMFGDQLVDSLPTFFETLQELHVRFRAAFVWNVDGTVSGGDAYIDDSFSVTEATNAALEMLEDGRTRGDNDANFQTLINALHQNEGWLLEDADWELSKLSLITIQRDTERSGGSWSKWVGQAQTFKEDKELVVFHAIAGPVPGGCGPAVPFMDYNLAVDDTGGMLLSVCEPDWIGHMSALATAAVEGASGIFQLEGTPVKESIEVAVDGEDLVEGWVFDEDKNAVIFDSFAQPPYGATVSIYYWMSGSCG